jgi:putative tricarboxylic transport membrane protein
MSADKGTSLFWLFVSIVVSIAAFRLNLGKLSAPGSGFMPFGAAVLLGLLSIVCFLQAVTREKTRAKAEPLFRGKLWHRVVFSCLALFAYAQAIPFLGYNITTFLLMTFLFWMAGRQKVWRVVVYSLGTTVITYYVFSKSLNLQFPVGPFGF